MSFLKTLRKLILGETRALPIGIAAAVAIAAGVRLIAGPHGAWSHAGGFGLLAMLIVALSLALPRRR